LRISRALYDEMVAHALAEAPNECCGIVASVDGEALRVFPAENLHASPLRYELAPADAIRIDEEIGAHGWDYGAIYHSHTRSAPLPSETDINHAWSSKSGPVWPGTVYIIIGLDADEPDVRTWRIESKAPQEVELSVE
jgi:proteasome lid subunit RPN8/RPN11